VTSAMTEHADAIIVGIRVYTVTVGFLVAIIGTAQWRRWMTFLPENQMAWLAVAAFNFSMVFGTFEVLGKGVPGGPRSFIAAIAVTFALFAVMHHPLHRLRRWRENRRVIRRYDR
jgi:hypothetical protein